MSWYDSVKCSEGQWSQPLRVSEYPHITRTGRKDKIPEVKGVYMIIVLANGYDSTAAWLDRVGGKDDTGTLYVGIGEGRYGLAGRIGRKMVGASFHAQCNFSEPLARRFPTDRLAVVWCEDSAPTRLEELLVHAYENVYGEFPPLNRSISVRERA